MYLYVQRKVEAQSCKNCRSEKAISITYSECVCSLNYPAAVASVLQHTKHMHRVTLSSVASLALHFSTLPHKQQDFGEKVTEDKMWV
jgi:hypothetical protein